MNQLNWGTRHGRRRFEGTELRGGSGDIGVRALSAGNSESSLIHEERPARINIALGVERFGLIPLRKPLLSLAIALILAVLAGFGVQKIKIDDSLSQLFRTDRSSESWPR